MHLTYLNSHLAYSGSISRRCTSARCRKKFSRREHYTATKPINSNATREWSNQHVFYFSQYIKMEALQHQFHPLPIKLNHTGPLKPKVRTSLRAPYMGVAERESFVVR